jgi:hypothetical protein
MVRLVLDGSRLVVPVYPIIVHPSTLLFSIFPVMRRYRMCTCVLERIPTPQQKKHKNEQKTQLKQTINSK